jgi:hypothetical protein
VMSLCCDVGGPLVGSHRGSFCVCYDQGRGVNRSMGSCEIGFFFCFVYPNLRRRLCIPRGHMVELQIVINMTTGSEKGELSLSCHLFPVCVVSCFWPVY